MEDQSDGAIIKGYLGCLSGSSSFRSSGEMSWKNTQAVMNSVSQLWRFDLPWRANLPRVLPPESPAACLYRPSLKMKKSKLKSANPRRHQNLFSLTAHLYRVSGGQRGGWKVCGSLSSHTTRCFQAVLHFPPLVLSLCRSDLEIVFPQHLLNPGQKHCSKELNK